ncbi:MULTISPECIES: hypothetical protein [Streptosporangium]|uniref:Uncharacterized protein n=1 Tax=Streptosporangium brasiliense TaxID=47480 RepID=A0ABT9RBF4_9ACTN|nr:hypothetical protein [Streptosporangium brasiliense]MDP9866598.1 hypothetical protein [Streptosporangium brasiliense]
MPQIVGGALATMTAAVAASYLGVAGTVIGAAVMSVGSTVGGAVYTHYLKRTGTQLTFLRGHEAADDPPRKVEGEGELATAARATVRGEAQARWAGGPAPAELDAPTSVLPAVGTVDPDAPTSPFPVSRPASADPDAPTSVLPAVGGGAAPSADDLDGLVVVDVDPATAELPRITDGTHADGPRVRVWMLAVTAVVTFALGMGAILGFEGLTGQPVSSTVRGEKGSGTSLNPGAGKRDKSPDRVKHSRPASPAPPAIPDRTSEPTATADSGQPERPGTEPPAEPTPSPTPTRTPTPEPTSGPTQIDPSPEPSDQPTGPPPSELPPPDESGPQSEGPEGQSVLGDG